MIWSFELSKAFLQTSLLGGPPVNGKGKQKRETLTSRID